VLLDTDDSDDATATGGSGNINQSSFRPKLFFIGGNAYLMRSESKSNTCRRQACDSCCGGKNGEVIFLVRNDIDVWDEGTEKRWRGSLRDIYKHPPASSKLIKAPFTRQILTKMCMPLNAEPQFLPLRRSLVYDIIIPSSLHGATGEHFWIFLGSTVSLLGFAAVDWIYLWFFQVAAIWKVYFDVD